MNSSLSIYPAPVDIQNYAVITSSSSLRKRGLVTNAKLRVRSFRGSFGWASITVSPLMTLLTRACRTVGLAMMFVDDSGGVTYDSREKCVEV